MLIHGYVIFLNKFSDLLFSSMQSIVSNILNIRNFIRHSLRRCQGSGRIGAASVEVLQVNLEGESRKRDLLVRCHYLFNGLLARYFMSETPLSVELTLEERSICWNA